MSIYVTTVTQKGQVTIPGGLRRMLGLKPKDKVALDLVDGEVRLRPIKSAVLASYGAVEPLKPPTQGIDPWRIRRETEEVIADEVAKEG